MDKTVSTEHQERLVSPCVPCAEEVGRCPRSLRASSLPSIPSPATHTSHLSGSWASSRWEHDKRSSVERWDARRSARLFKGRRASCWMWGVAARGDLGVALIRRATLQ